MAQPKETYVDPALNSNTGAGTIGDPWGDLQHALNQAGHRDATNGNRVNIKAGTAEVMTAGITLATFGTPAIASPLIFQGYTAAAGDGGIGEINNNAANVTVMTAATTNYVSFVDMKLGNCGSAVILSLGSGGGIIACELHTSTSTTPVVMTTLCRFMNNYVHNVGGSGTSHMVTATSSAFMYGNLVVNNRNAANTGRCVNYTSGTVAHNIIVMQNNPNVNATGIYNTLADGYVYNNTILATTAQTGTGIHFAGTTTNAAQNISSSNIIEGFSGTGGAGIRGVANTYDHTTSSNNTFSNVNVAYPVDYEYIRFSGNEEVSGASVFEKSGTLNYANRFNYFYPKNVGKLWDGGWLGNSRGAIPVHKYVAASGGLKINPGMTGNVRG